MTTNTTRSRATKKPADRKPKKSEGRTITIEGVDFTISESAVNDWELIEDFADMESGEAQAVVAMPRMLRRVLGDRYAEAKDLLRDENGVITVKAGVSIAKQVLQVLNPNS